MHCRARHAQLRRFVRSYTGGTTFAKNPVLVECLPSRSVLRIAGSNVTEYLQGLVTNDMDHILQGSASMFAMFLNSKGRVLYDAIIYHGKEKDTLLIECDHEAANDLKAHLNLYKVRRKISVDSLENDVNVWNVNSCETVLSNNNSGSKKALLDQVGCLKEFTGSSDPRVGELGWRVIIPKECYLVTAFRHRGINVIEGLNYKTLRYKLGVAEGVDELPPGNCFPLEANCDYLHGVSFHKGCYIGQELTARTYHTGVVRKRLMPLVFDEEASALPFDTVIKAPAGENTLGKLRGAAGRLGIGLLRIEEVLKAEQLEASGTKLKTFRPFWWPAEAPKEKRNAV